MSRVFSRGPLQATSCSILPIDLTSLDQPHDMPNIETSARTHPGHQHFLAGLQACTRLQRLDVSGNALDCLDAVASCQLLLHLNAARNRIATFPRALPVGLLASLSLQANRSIFTCISAFCCSVIELLR